MCNQNNSLLDQFPISPTSSSHFLPSPIIGWYKMDGQDALARLRRHHADLAEDLLCSQDSHLDIMIQLEQEEVVEHSQILEDALRAQSITQIRSATQTAFERFHFRQQQEIYGRRGMMEQGRLKIELSSFHVRTELAHQDALRGASKPKIEKSGRKSCTACTEVVESPRRLDLQCGHAYCKACVVFMVSLAVDDITTWPARCCSPIEPSKLASLLPNELQARYEQRTLEWSTANPTYCHDTQCATFIVQSDGQEQIVTKCPRCQKDTCTICKQGNHKGRFVQEALPEEVAMMAATEEWQSCPSCKRMIELTGGCHHITCHCRTEFCYECAQVWKDCACPHWREDRLLSRAARAAVREAMDDNPATAARGLRRLVEQIREAGVTCNHGGLRRINRPGVCDDCGQGLDVYLYRGCRCRLEVCLWCRDTRHGLLGLRDSAQNVRGWEVRSWKAARKDGAQRARRFRNRWQGVPNHQRLDHATAVQRAGRLTAVEERHNQAVERRQEAVRQQQALIRLYTSNNDA